MYVAYLIALSFCVGGLILDPSSEIALVGCSLFLLLATLYVLYQGVRSRLFVADEQGVTFFGVSLIEASECVRRGQIDSISNDEIEGQRQLHFKFVDGFKFSSRWINSIQRYLINGETYIVNGKIAGDIPQLCQDLNTMKETYQKAA